MSASTKKKLRKEQNAAALTERQQAEQIKAKKLKRNTIIFVVAIALIAAAFVGILVYRWLTNNAILEKATTAAEIGNEELDSVQFNYYYRDAILEVYNEWYSTAYEYVELTGMDVYECIENLFNFDSDIPLSEQLVEVDGDQTWDDYFIEIALENAREDIALVNAAKKAGYTMPEESKQSLKNQETNLNSYAYLYGYYNAKEYLTALYGDSANVDTYIEYLETTMLADLYLEHYTNELNEITYEQAAMDEFVGENTADYNGYSYNYVYLGYTAFRETSEDGTYTDEQNNAAREACKAAAETLTSATTVEEFDEAIKALELSTTSSTAQRYQLHTAVSVTQIKDWLAEGGHTEGEIVILPNETTSTDADGNETKVTNGYYVVRYIASYDNAHSLSNIRHLLVSFDPDDSGIEVTDEVKESTLAKAEELLAQFEAGETTEAAFEELVREHSDDNADEGGLYTDVGAHTSFVEPFLNWCIAEERQAGDYEIVETEYGYHIMYFCERQEITYRDSLIMADMHEEALATWRTEQLEATPAKVVNTKYLDRDLVMSET